MAADHFSDKTEVLLFDVLLHFLDGRARNICRERLGNDLLTVNYASANDLLGEGIGGRAVNEHRQDVSNIVMLKKIDDLLSAPLGFLVFRRAKDYQIFRVIERRAEALRQIG